VHAGIQLETFSSKMKVIVLFQLPNAERSVRGGLGTGEILPFPNHIQQKMINVLITERNYQ